MKYRLLGRTGLYVSELCLGTMTYGGDGFWNVMGQVQQPEVTQQVKVAFEAGVNFIDTANVYSLGRSEQLVGQAIKDLALPRNQLIVATKATGVMDERLPNGRGQSRYHLMNELDASLKRLQLDHVDLYQLHGFDPLVPLEDVLATLNDMVRGGKVRYIGLCNFAAWQIMKALALSDKNGWARFESVQAHYTIAGRDLEREIVPLINDQKLGLMVWSPLAGGLLSGKFALDKEPPKEARRAAFDFPVVDKARAYRCIDAMRLIAERHQVSVARVALAWLLGRPHVSSIVIGAKSAEQLADNLAAETLELTEEEQGILDDVSRLPSEYPGWMLKMQGRYRSETPSTKPGTPA